MIAESRRRTQAGARALWAAYVRVPRPIRWPLTALLLVFLGVIAANLVFDTSRAVERTYLIAPGASATLQVQVDAGRNSEVTWEIVEREPGDATAFPLQARLSGPAAGLPRQSAAGSGRFPFKAGFTRDQFELVLTNLAETRHAPVEVRWTVR